MNAGRRFFVVLALLAGTACYGCARAADAIRVNVDAENPPFMSVCAGEPCGVYPAVLRAAFARIKQPLSLDTRPWKRALLELEEGRAGVGGIYKNNERAARYDFSEPIFTEKIVVYFNTSRPINFRTLADLDGRRVGVIRGWSYGDAFDAAREQGRFVIEDVTNDKANFLKLAHGRLDAVVAVEEAGNAVIAAEKLSAIARGRVLLANNTAHLAFNHAARKTALIAQFNVALGEMKRDGTLDEIVHAELSRWESTAIRDYRRNRP